MSSSADTDTVFLDGNFVSKPSDAQKSTKPLFSIDLKGSRSLHSHSTIRRFKINWSFGPVDDSDDDDDALLLLVEKKCRSTSFV